MLPKSFSVGQAQYLALQPSKVSVTMSREHGCDNKLRIFSHIDQVTPPYVTVFRLYEGCKCVEENWVRDTVAEYEKVDDVFRTEFLSDVMFTCSSKVEDTPGASIFLHSQGTTIWIEVTDSNLASSPPPEFYHIIEKKLHDIWKLYKNSQGAFLTALVTGING